jgi:hypothetical protein
MHAAFTVTVYTAAACRGPLHYAAARSSSSSWCTSTTSSSRQQYRRAQSALRMVGGIDTKEATKTADSSIKSGKMKTDAQDFPVLNIDPDDTGLKVTLQRTVLIPTYSLIR